MDARGDESSQAERLVMEFLGTHGPTTMERLAHAWIGLTWGQVFSAVDRLSRANKVQMHQTHERDYLIALPSSYGSQRVRTVINETSVKPRELT